MKTRTILIAIGVMALAAAAHAGAPPASLEMVPPQLNYQGQLMAPDNTPYKDGPHEIELSLYSDAVGGTTNWSEGYTVQTRGGYFSVNLGSDGTPLLKPASRNKEIWKVLWKDVTDAGTSNTFYMAITVRTDPNGITNSSPVESSPRQQFLTAPFAYRAHQSVYASKADGLFSAGSINTTNLSATDVSTIALTSSNLTVARLHLDSTNAGSLLIKSKPMFVYTEATAPFLALASSVTVPHNLSLAEYEVFVVGWEFSFAGGFVGTQTTVRGIYMAPGMSGAVVYFRNGAERAGTMLVTFMGIRRGLIGTP